MERGRTRSERCAHDVVQLRLGHPAAKLGLERLDIDVERADESELVGRGSAREL